MSTIAIYTTPPQRERKAQEEIRRAGGKAYLPTEERTHKTQSREVKRRYPIVPGYVFATDKPYDAVYVRAKVGEVDRKGVVQLMLTGRVRRLPRLENPFKKGDSVLVPRGKLADDESSIRAKVIEVRARTCIIAYDMLGKTHQQAIAYAQLRPG